MMTHERLLPGDRAILQRVLAQYADCIDRVGLFGSRATGVARPNSDIDLVLYGSLSDAEADRLWTLFDDSDLSVSVDPVVYTSDLYPPLRRHIDESVKMLFSHQDLVQSPVRPAAEQPCVQQMATRR